MARTKRLHPNRKPFVEWLMRTRETAAIAVSDLAGEMAQDRCLAGGGNARDISPTFAQAQPIEAQVALGYAHRSWTMGDEQYVAHEPGTVKLTRVDRYSTRVVSVLRW